MEARRTTSVPQPARPRSTGPRRGSPSDASACSQQRFILEPRVSSAVASALWARLTWSKALFGLLVVNLVWTASLFICPFLVSPGSFANQVGGATVIDLDIICATCQVTPRVYYKTR